MKTPVMVMGLPGKMATEAARKIANSDDFELWPYSLTGPKDREIVANVEGVKVHLYDPAQRIYFSAYSRFPADGLVVDFTLGHATKDNVMLYRKNEWPFVMGTTKIDKPSLEKMVKESSIIAVIANNMALPIVSLQAFMEKFAQENAGLMREYRLRVQESHQSGKLDTSGTAIAMVRYFNALGIDFKEEGIDKVRDPAAQRQLGVPKEYLNGHGWHKYTITAPSFEEIYGISEFIAKLNSDFFSSNPALRGYEVLQEHPYARAISPDKTVFLELHDADDDEAVLTHNINGRSVYAEGNLEALRFLRENRGQKGQVYSMIDVLNSLQ